MTETRISSLPSAPYPTNCLELGVTKEPTTTTRERLLRENAEKKKKGKKEEKVFIDMARWVDQDEDKRHGAISW